MKREGIKLLNEASVSGRRAFRLAELSADEGCEALASSEALQRAWADDAALFADEAPALPELSELDVIRHFTQLSTRNYSVDLGFYPLGSCTMKYNPRINEQVASLPGFTEVHPLSDAEDCQGLMRLFAELEQALCAITGYDHFSLQPAAGAQGELAGMLILRAYHEARGDLERREILIPDAAHGTNPASAAAAGFDVVVLASDEDGCLDAETVRRAVGPQTAGLMLTNPNTLGLFERDIVEIAELVHEAGGLVYYDGANANAIVGRVRPGDMGFDICHLNLHKTFSTPHGGGGPGAGPVGVRAGLEAYLPGPVIAQDESGRYVWRQPEASCGALHAFHGNSLVLLRALAYIRSIGGPGLADVSGHALLNANYLAAQLSELWPLASTARPMHEVVFSGKARRDRYDVSTLDVAKRLIDLGYHPPTVYFPLIVPEALMIEPTETESLETLDGFVAAMRQIAEEMETDPERLRTAPHEAVIGRPDEALAARKPLLTWMQMGAD